MIDCFTCLELLSMHSLLLSGLCNLYFLFASGKEKNALALQAPLQIHHVQLLPTC